MVPRASVNNHGSGDPWNSRCFLFREAGQPADDRSLPEPTEPTEEMLQSLFATGERYGFEFLGPLPERAE